MPELITLNNIDSDAVNSFAALATDNATLNGTTTLGAATETVSLPTFVLSIMRAEQAKIQASDAQAADLFGFSVSISSDGNTAIVGAGSEDAGGFNAGAAYIFVRSGSTWTQQAKILSSDSQDYDYIGRQVSISSDGNIAIIGAYGEDTGGSEAGAAYIFTRSGTTWSQQAKIQASDKEANDQFGCSVSISSDGLTAIVGARYEGPAAGYAGAAYIFVRSGTSWTQQAKIQASDIQDYDQFGQSVSISGDGNTVIVGAWYEDTGASDAGAAYIFVRSGTSWTQQAKIQASDKEVSDQFGHSVSISGDGNTVIVGARYEDTGATGAGAAYIFVKSGSTWSQQAKIQASDPEANDWFGTSVSISGDGNTVIVGADGEDTGGSEAGAAYIFTRSGTTWTETQKIRASNTSTTAQFGYSVSISSDGNTAIVGAAFEDPSELDVGAAYIYATEVISAVWSFDMSQSSIFVHDTATENFTANFINVPTTNDRTISAALIIPQGAAGYLPTAVQIDGESQVILWQGAVAPEPSINATDVVRFTLLRSGGTWSVLGAVNKFGYAGLPVVTSILMSDSSLKIGETSTLTITFDKAATGFDNTYITVASGTLTDITSADGGITWTGTFTPTDDIEDATNVITVGTYTDLLGNVPSTDNYTIDTLRPALTSIALSSYALAKGETATVTVTFSEAVVWSPDSNSIYIDAPSNGAFSTLTSVDGGVTWTCIFTPTDNINALNNYVSVVGSGWTDLAGNSTNTDNAVSANFSISTTPWTHKAILIASDAASSDQMGSSLNMSSDGTTIITGAPSANPSGLGDAGAAYIYTLTGSTWSQQAILSASDKGGSDYFGTSVNISSDGNTAVVGSHYEDPAGIVDAGAAYIFVRSGTTWTQQAKLQASDKEATDNFGWSSSISDDGNYVIIGANNEDTGGSSAGAAYIFVRSGTTWTQQAKIQASDKAANDQFGRETIGMSGNGSYAIVGAYLEDTGGNAAGAAYIFVRSGTTWTQQAKIQASDAAALDFFGVTVDIDQDGNTAVVGAMQQDPAGIVNAGAAYIFTRSGSTWTQQSKLVASDKETEDNLGEYGVSISSDGNTVILGVREEDAMGSNAGAAYVFKRSGSTWSQHAKVLATDGEASDFFGRSVSVNSNGTRIAVGANNYDPGNPAISNAGGVYVYDIA